MKSTTSYQDKLNLGCGYDYLRGYLNVDYFNQAVADVKMSVTALELPHDHFTEIVMKDVIEHLGYCNSLAVLAKCYMLLRKDGILIIRTPDIEKSFEQYISAKTIADKENILCHIYGIEDPGMCHVCCLPLSMFDSLLSKSGFKITRCDYSEVHTFRPNITITAQKVDNTHFARRNPLINSILKNKKIKISYADFPYFEQIVEDFLKITTQSDLQDVVEKYKTVSPKLLLLLLKMDLLTFGNPYIAHLTKMLRDSIKKYSKEYYCSDFYTPVAMEKTSAYTRALEVKNH